MSRKVLRVSRAISRRLSNQGAEAVVLMGSWARGDAYDESDIDIRAIGKGPAYRLECKQNFLISISWTTARQNRQAFRDPKQVGGIIPAWRNAVILYDPDGIAENLKQMAHGWRWNSLNSKADEWVAEEITGWAEEVHRLIGNFRLKRMHATAVQRFALAVRMAPMLAVHHRILYDTENQLWDLVCARMGAKWTKLQSIALLEDVQSFEDACKATLQLYALTANEVKHLLDKRQYQVVAHACEIAGYRLRRKDNTLRTERKTHVDSDLVTKGAES